MRIIKRMKLYVKRMSRPATHALSMKWIDQKKAKEVVLHVND